MERHIVFVATNQPGTRCDQTDVDGARKAAVSLPYVKCLDDPLPGERRKYFKPEDTIGKLVLTSSENTTKPIRKELYIPLTKREKELLALADKGWSTREIASYKHRSETYVRSSISVARKKLYVQGIIKTDTNDSETCPENTHDTHI